mmetsp:Transcript_25266/g.54918  ORF Transcript_25266/g.54918 Transcript_25266/m.54918 type:complete len:243 (-) Transcript_25266:1530-2258(-)
MQCTMLVLQPVHQVLIKVSSTRMVMSSLERCIRAWFSIMSATRAASAPGSSAHALRIRPAARCSVTTSHSPSLASTRKVRSSDRTQVLLLTNGSAVKPRSSSFRNLSPSMREMFKPYNRVLTVCPRRCRRSRSDLLLAMRWSSVILTHCPVLMLTSSALESPTFAACSARSPAGLRSARTTVAVQPSSSAILASVSRKQSLSSCRCASSGRPRTRCCVAPSLSLLRKVSGISNFAWLAALLP